jgi:hypothetical protein
LSGSVGSTYDLLQVYTSVHIRHRAGADRHHPKLDWHGWAFSVPSLASSRTCAFETRLDSPRPTLPLPPPPCFDVCTLLSPAALCSLLSHVGARPVAASHLRRTPLVLRASPKNMLCSGGIGAGLGQVWVRCFNVRRLAFEGRRSWGRTRSSPFFPSVLSPACFPPLPPPPCTPPPPTTWLPLSSEEGEPGACSAVFRFVRPPRPGKPVRRGALISKRLCPAVAAASASMRCGLRQLKSFPSVDRICGRHCWSLWIADHW